MSVRKRKDTKSVRWQASWKNPQGKWQAKDFKTKAEAERFEVKMKAEVSIGDYVDPNSGKILMTEVYASWKKSSSRLKPKTVASYESIWNSQLAPVWGNRSVASITRAQIKDWATNLNSVKGNKKLSPSRVRHCIVLLKLLFQHAIDMESLGKNPLAQTKGILPKLEEVNHEPILEYHQLEKLAEECGNYRLMILLAGYVGLRWAEVIALVPEDFDFKTKKIKINKSLSEVSGTFHLVTTKSGKSRTAPILDLLARDLMELVVSTPKGVPIFRSPKGGYLRHSNFSKRYFKPAASKLGLPKLTFHHLRHSAISQLAHNGANMVAVSKLVGHSKPSTTLKIYTHEVNGSFEQVTETLNSIIAQGSSDRFTTDSSSKTA